MPYHDGKYVSLERWHELQPKKKKLMPWESDPDEEQVEQTTAPHVKKQPKPRAKQESASKAAEDATGVKLPIIKNILGEEAKKKGANPELLPVAQANTVSAHKDDPDINEGTAIERAQEEAAAAKAQAAAAPEETAENLPKGKAKASDSDAE